MRRMSRDQVVQQAREVVALWERWSRPGDVEPPDVRAARATIRLLSRRRLVFTRTR
jgi:hypothetical protein